MNQTIQAADLFCGAGGFSSGLLQACHEHGRRAELLAVNHWPKAIATHKLNHPGVSHLCENLDNVDPRKVVAGQRLDVLLASPECTHHSRARGGKPMSDQSRSSAYHIHRWAEALYVKNIVVENVKEFTSWGPLDSKGRPMASKKGELFRKFCETLEAMGFYVDYRVLNAAWYGEATSRERLFIQATRGRRPRWPERTHSDTPNLYEQKYKAAREIIDWSVESQSIFGRKKPLAPKTLKRIEAGLKKFGGVEFVIGQQSCAAPRDVANPLPTIATAGAISLVEPFLVVLRNNMDGKSLDNPLGTVCTSPGHFALCEPFVVNMRHFGDDGHSRRCQPLERPLPTVTGNGAFGLCEPFVVPVTHGGGEGRCHGLEDPLPTITTAKRGEMALIEPFLVRYNGDHSGREDGAERVYPLDDPIGTLDTSNRYGIAEPYLVKYYGTATAADCGEPLDTLTTKARFGLCQPEPLAIFERDGHTYALLDIRFRMLQPHELAAAMGFEHYEFTGTKADQVKMIGNAVSRRQARAICRTLFF